MIQFAHPPALWLLALIIPIIALYLLKQKRRELEVPSVMLWKQAIEDLRSHTPFQKLRTNLLLLLQILVVVLITAVLSQPYLPRAAHGSRKYILAIDASASMKAGDVKPDRLSAAKTELSRILDSMSPDDESMLISFSAQASTIQPYTSNKNAVRKNLADVQAQDVAGEWNQLTALLEPLSKKTPAPKIVIASDFSGIPAEFVKKFSFDPLLVGTSGENVGITRAGLQHMPENRHQQTLFYQIKNFGGRSRETDVAIYSDSKLLDAFHTRLSAGEKEDRSLEIEIDRPALLRIEIQNKDDFQLDNDFVLSAKPAGLRTVQAQLNDPFLIKALQALPSVMITNAGKISISDREQPGAGIAFLTASADTPAAEIIQWNASHPVFRFVNAGLWRLQHSRVLNVPENGVALLETRQGLVGYAVENSGIRKIILGFGLSQSNLYLRAGFPVFLQNAIDWIQEGLTPPGPVYTSAEFPSEGMTVGQSYVNFADEKESHIAPERPSGSSHAGTANFSSRIDLSSYFLILLIVVVIVEWWVFHQRIHVEA